jgi:hypothetical protein
MKETASGQDLEARIKQNVDQLRVTIQPQEYFFHRLARVVDMRKENLHKPFAEAGCPLMLPRWRVPSTDQDEIAPRVSHFRDVLGIKCGCKQTAESRRELGQDSPYDAVRGTLRNRDIFYRAEEGTSTSIRGNICERLMAHAPAPVRGR